MPAKTAEVVGNGKNCVQDDSKPGAEVQRTELSATSAGRADIVLAAGVLVEVWAPLAEVPDLVPAWLAGD